MSTLSSLSVLLLVAYVGGFLMGGRGMRGRGLPSGTEWVLVGLLAGPAVLGMVSGADLEPFWPLSLLATGWIALLVGLTFGVDGNRPVGLASILLGAASGILAFVAVGGSVWAVVNHWAPASRLFPSPVDRAALAVTVGASLADTSRHVSAWAAGRLGARGPLLDRVAGITRSDDVVPIAALSALVVLDPSRGGPFLPGGGALVGALLGLACAALLGRTLRTTTFWALLFGTTLLASGIAEQLDLSVMTAGFALGLALAVASPLRESARSLASGVEGTVVIPALLLVGARFVMPGAAAAPVLAAALLARLAAAVIVAGLVALVDRTARRAGAWLVLVFFPVGPLGLAIALAIGLRRPGGMADLSLAIAIAAGILGEFLGPPALRRALRRAGELPATPPPATPDQAGNASAADSLEAA